MKKELNPQNIIDEINDHLFDYDKIKEDSVIIIQNPEELYDINVIIPVRGRTEFASAMYNSFLAAKEKSDLKITYTIAEFSHIPEHSKFCKKNKINYLWISSEKEELFNKCLAFNAGVFFGNVAKYVLMHDLDCLMQSDFFTKLEQNIASKKCEAIQCFTGRRVLYCNPELTSKIVAGEFDIDTLSIDMPEVDYPRLGGQIMIGAPGGSILIGRDLFFNVGGYDPELFQANSPEDAFFWEKVDTISKMEVSDDPDIELYHMFHPPTYYSNPKIQDMQAAHQYFQRLDEAGKKKVIQHKADIISKYRFRF